MKPSRSMYLDVRGLRYHVRCWGTEGAPKLFMLHGWMDVSASFQFVVDALARDWHVLAPDWRGFGLTEWTRADNYWYPDYFADLERLLDHFQHDRPVDIVGHSMGGNIACVYAGVRPARIRRLVNLEGFGLGDNPPGDAPGRLGRWLDGLARPPGLRDYGSFDEVAARLAAANPRLTPERAAFLARHWGEELPGGRIRLRGDPRHKIVNPFLYRAEEFTACLRAITAPVLWLEGSLTDIPARFRLSEEELARRRHSIANLREMRIDGAGHMLHHDQPERVARAIEDFLAG